MSMADDYIEVRVEARGCYIYFIYSDGSEFYVGTREEAVRKHLGEFND